MSYQGRSSHPDWESTALTLKEVLEDVLQQLQDDNLEGVRPDIAVLSALDTLEGYFAAVKLDLGL